MASSADKKREDDYRAEDDLRTLERAAEVSADGGRMEACARVHKRKQNAAARVGRLFSKRGGGRSARA
jgi:hypothetical protein